VDKPKAAVHASAAALRLLALDVDGTLTDGRIYIGRDGEVMKAFSVHDGFGITLLREAGLVVAIITARQSSIVERRAAELGIAEVIQGAHDKRAAFETLCARHHIPLAQACFAGDDWPDLPALSVAGLAASVADAADAVRARAHWVSTKRGGEGAVRELAEFILESKGLLQAALERRLKGAAAPGKTSASECEVGQ
jgi:3-deoxy-D-manno-octulosonate 8-phosphate phosphatase (KDO 8-P phosphatase)